MPRSSTYYLQQTMLLLHKAVHSVVAVLQPDAPGDIFLSQSIFQLQEPVLRRRDMCIVADLIDGMSGRDVAVKYGLSGARVSQIRTTYEQSQMVSLLTNE